MKKRIHETTKSADTRVAEALSPLDRQATDPILDQLAWDVWGYARDNADSLDSQRHCDAIKKKLDTVLRRYRAKIETLMRDGIAAKAEASKVKKQLRETVK